MNLKEGDDIDVQVAGKREFDVARDLSRVEALEKIRQLARPFPVGFRFDRDDANSR